MLNLQTIPIPVWTCDKKKIAIYELHFADCAYDVIFLFNLQTSSPVF
jgi:hypothetical protein